MSKERSGHTLQTTALIHEAVIRLLKSDGIDWHSRVQFYAIAARRMRQILVEHAREQLTAKRGSRAEHLNLSAATHLSIEKSLELINLDAALTELAKLDQRKSNIVEYRYFGGFTIPEIAKMFGVSTATIEREWSLARSWLLKQMSSATGI
jgi:RNA polymerase sigma factor (TIGR02999 family)